MLSDWTQANLPAFFSTPGPLTLRLWQVLATPLVLTVAYLAARLASAVLSRVGLRVAKLTTAKWDDLLVEKLRAPLRLLMTGVFGLALLPMLELQGVVHTILFEFLRIVVLVALFWGLLRSVDIAHETVRDSDWARARPALRPVFSVLVRVPKVVIIALAVISCLQQLGYPVTGIIAGLGVGGVAVALAAQKTLEHFLGFVMLSVDRPFQPGSLIKVDELTGVVEQIGLRSTRVRTSARTVVSCPNGKLADARIENFSARDRIFLNAVVGLDYDTSLTQLRAITKEMKAYFLGHAKSWKDELHVHVTDFGETSIQLEVQAWFKLEVDDNFRDVREESLLAMMDIVERHGAAFALPARKVIMKSSDQELSQGGREPGR